LEIVLAEWSPPVAGLLLYYPRNRRAPSALKALIEILRENFRTFAKEGG